MSPRPGHIQLVTALVVSCGRLGPDLARAPEDRARPGGRERPLCLGKLTIELGEKAMADVAATGVTDVSEVDLAPFKEAVKPRSTSLLKLEKQKPRS